MLPSPSSDPHLEHNEQTISKIGEILNRKASVARLVSRTVADLNRAYTLRSTKSPGDLIFDLFRPSEHADEASVHKLIKVLRSFGILENDPRLRLTLHRLASFEAEADEDDSRNFYLAREPFKYTIQSAVALISHALRNQLVIPNWDTFVDKIQTIFDECRPINEGKVATYIPQLARQSPDLWGMSICTIDGQRCSFGDSKFEFCLQSVSKAFNYSIVASDLGADVVHSYVGHEPSGRLFNDICLDPSGKPHNPMINAGAIITTSLIKSGLTMADRFDFVLHKYKQLAGGEHVGFNNATFLSERDSADRNYALSYYMKEYNCFPPGIAGIREELDLYFQLCSLETTCETLAVMAATLANGGVCPLTDERCVAPQPCRDVLSLMYSCGMYDLSGKFAFQVGLPAKSGVSGAMIVVIPNVMGICLFSPPLDQTGNSTRGVAFCKKLIEAFNFHNYDSLQHTDSHKIDPRRRIGNRDTDMVVSLLFAAKNGDIEVIKRMYLQGGNLEIADYDGRTALHIAASEGQYQVAKFLLNTAKVGFQPKDRWGRTPIDDARMFDHDDCVKLLNKAIMKEQGAGQYGSLMEESENDTTSSESDSDATDDEGAASDSEGLDGPLMIPPLPKNTDGAPEASRGRGRVSLTDANAPLQALLEHIPRIQLASGYSDSEKPELAPGYVPTPKKGSSASQHNEFKHEYVATPKKMSLNSNAGHHGDFQQDYVATPRKHSLNQDHVTFS